MEPCIHAAFKARERQKPCVVMIRAESIYPVHLRSATVSVSLMSRAPRSCATSAPNPQSQSRAPDDGSIPVPDSD